MEVVRIISEYLTLMLIRLNRTRHALRNAPIHVSGSVFCSSAGPQASMPFILLRTHDASAVFTIRLVVLLIQF